MKPKWFRDSIPLDPLIAPMVLFFQDHGIKTLESCQGGDKKYHLYGRPTIRFAANSLKDVEDVTSLLTNNYIETGSMVGLIVASSFFGGKDGAFGLAEWVWSNHYKEKVYERVIKLVDMKQIESITRDHREWKKAGYPSIG